MSLASRVRSLFSGSSQQLEGDHNEIGFKNDGSPGAEALFGERESLLHARSSENMAPKNVEEEGRPPYIYVCAAYTIAPTGRR
jgi:hypothetical protein